MGRNIGEWYFIPFVVDMPTAIAVVFTEYGFAMAADGRTCEEGTGRVISDQTQKIFPLVLTNGRNLACAVTGAAVITKPDSDEILFNFLSEMPKALERIAQVTEPNHWHFAHALGKSLIEPLTTATASFPSLGESKTDILMAGYYRGPECVVLSLTSLAGGNIESEVSRRELVLDTPYGYGSKAIFKRVSGLELDPAFEKYRAIAAYRHHTIRRAVQIAENAVRAHCDPVARDLDPKAYAIVGGHIHVAQITAGEGFSWAIPPLP